MYNASSVNSKNYNDSVNSKNYNTSGVNSKNYNYWGNKSQDIPYNFIFGFGSIINDESRKSTVPEAGDPIPVRISSDFGYKRVWNFQSSSAKLTALGLIKAENCTINGVIYPVKTNDIPILDSREEGYTRTEVPIEYVESCNWQELPKHPIKIWIYIPNGKTRVPGTELVPSDKYYPILQTYLDIVILGCLKYGIEYTVEFLYTTGWWNKYWLNDRQVPRRPWIFQKRYREIDNVIKEISKQYGLEGVDGVRRNYYLDSKLPEEFRIYFLTENNDSSSVKSREQAVETRLNNH